MEGTHEQSPRLRDLVYFDFDKTSSILSQVEGGLLKEFVSGSESLEGRDKAHEFNAQVYKPRLGTTSSEKLSELSTRVLHHDLLVRVERKLFVIGAAVDLNSTLGGEAPTEALARQALEGEAYVRAEGWVAFEDYERMSSFCDFFPKLAEMIRKSLRYSLEQNPAYQEVEKQLAQARDGLKSLPSNQRVQEKQKIQQLQLLLKSMQESVEQVNEPDPWIFDGIKNYVRMFLPNRIVMRIMPFDELPQFQMISSLKRDSFVDTDIDNLLFAFGSQPNVRLTILGIITSVPPESPVVRDFVSAPVADDGGGDDSALGFETAMRGVLSSMNGFEQFFRFSRYPSVTIYPLAVYRTIPLPEDADVQ